MLIFLTYTCFKSRIGFCSGAIWVFWYCLLMSDVCCFDAFSPFHIFDLGFLFVCLFVIFLSNGITFLVLGFQVVWMHVVPGYGLAGACC